MTESQSLRRESRAGIRPHRKPFMKRRDFLRRTAIGGSAFLITRTLSGAATQTGVVPTRRNGRKSFVLEETTVAELQRGITSGRFTAAVLVRRYLKRIEELDRNGPRLKAVIELNPDALAIAEALDKERHAKGPRGPLHGIPVLIKDNIDTHDRMTTTAGSLALEGSIAPRDAFVVERLRAAGAVVIGKANLSEWANFRGSRSISGWSGRLGWQGTKRLHPIPRCDGAARRPHRRGAEFLRLAPARGSGDGGRARHHAAGGRRAGRSSHSAIAPRSGRCRTSSDALRVQSRPQ